MKKFFLLAGIFIAASILTSKAQVTIGTTEEPVKGAMLQLKTKSDADSKGDINATQGLDFPRVALVVRNQLQPMYSSTEATNLTSQENMDHKGLVVYNVTNDPAADLSPGLYQWDGAQWTGLADKPSAAKIDFPADCSEITVNEDYFSGTPLNSSNYITIPVNVTQVGYYTISLVPNPANGYYFATSGTFMTTGPVLITIQGAGQPKNPTPDGEPGDALTLVCNADTSTCTPYVLIQDGAHKPYFAMSCNSVNVMGVYKKGATPTTGEEIQLRINVYDGALGAAYSAKTDVIDGLWFEGSGVLGTAGSQVIDLYAHGSSTNTAPKTFTITTNSQSTTATCTAIVTPVIGQKKIIAFGTNDYGFASGAGIGGCYDMVTDIMNYGTDPNSIVKYDGFTSVVCQDHTGSYTGPITSIPNTDALMKPITQKGTGYDIIIISYAAAILSQLQIDSLTNFVNNGGVLIDIDQFNTPNDINLIQSIFGETPFTNYADGAVFFFSDPAHSGGGSGSLIKMNPGINDELSNGPFGDVRNSQWGDDTPNTTTGLLTPPFGAIVYAGATGASTGVINVGGAQVTILRHPTKNFIWIGDGGFIGANTVNPSYTDHPFKTASRVINGHTYPHFPYSELYGYSTYPRLPVCNSIFFANIMAWALTQAEINGINSGQ